MKKYSTVIWLAILFVPVGTLLIDSAVQAQVACPGQSLQNAINSATPGTTITVTGTCNENITIRNDTVRIAIIGSGATLTSASGTTLIVRGKGITIQGFTITGGGNGIRVERSSNATINLNEIHAGARGIEVVDTSFAIITNNNIHDNGTDGILVGEASSARIGFSTPSDVAASPNTIQNNGDRGIIVTTHSIARIYGNTISGNGDDGVGIFRASHADLSSNTINGNGFTNPSTNGGNGVIVAQNSSLELGEDDPVDFTDQPNTTTSNNAVFGIRCSSGGNVRGHLGSSNALNGATSQFGGGTTTNTFSGTCPTAANTLSIP
ncbi:MAG TPA: right-handed parallel beta-helix repeat-containing protein [Methylomirabilota bacterium]|nr:right-handed parallel beta-helix repeat-containing protein [Methylomirabilota bacterium]